MESLQIAFRQALRFALEHHTGQTRKGTAVPYIVHPVAVAETLAFHYPENLELVVAGVLHDVVEDTDATLELVERRFGPNVRELVDAVTKPAIPADAPDEPEAKWRLEREGLLLKLADAGDDAHRLKAADTHANLRSLERDMDRLEGDPDVWTRFKGSEAQTLAYYRRVVDLVSGRLAGAGDRALLLELQRAADGVGA